MTLPRVSLLLQGEHQKDPDPAAFAPGMTVLIDPLTSSSTLIVGKSVSVVDAGTPPYRGRILARLEHEGVRPEEVEYLFITHGHQDHYLNCGLYPNATIITEPNVQLVGGGRCEVFDRTIAHDDWEIVPTPGHMPVQFSVVVRGLWEGEEKKIVMAGDAFREDLWHRGYYFGPNVKPHEQRSALWALQNADTLIPGHYRVLSKADISELLRERSLT